jgi:hypothetical protein
VVSLWDVVEFKKALYGHNAVGREVGNIVGAGETTKISTPWEGERLTEWLGCVLGRALGSALGEELGASLGDELGLALGEVLGEVLGFVLGDVLGALLGENDGESLRSVGGVELDEEEDGLSLALGEEL